MNESPGGNAGAGVSVAGGGSAGRLASLDAFRGLTIALMFFVNLSGNRDAFPAWFGHAGWNRGLHGQWLADYVFPWFLFIVGVAIPFSMHGGRGRGVSALRRIAGALRRGATLYLLGILIWCAKSSMDSFESRGTGISWATLLHWDILPLIGLGAFLGVAAHHLPTWVRGVLVTGVLLAKWLLMPDLAATGGLERSAWMAARTDMEAFIRMGGGWGGGWGGWWGTLAAQGLPATCCVVLGGFAGDWLRAGRASPTVKAYGLMAAGGAGVAIALAWARVFPVSKDFFTSTYVLLSAGSAAVALGFLYGALDAWRWSRAGVSGAGAAILGLCLGSLAWLHHGGEVTAGQVTASQVTAGQLHAAIVVLGSGAVGLLGLAGWDAWRGNSPPGRAAFLVIYGGNAIAVYVLSELLWTMVWMRWRVACPLDFGPQTAFAALQVHLRALVQPLAGADLARGLGPWLATMVYILAYWGLCLWLHRRRIVIKV